MVSLWASTQRLPWGLHMSKSDPEDKVCLCTRDLEGEYRSVHTDLGTRVQVGHAC